MLVLVTQLQIAKLHQRVVLVSALQMLGQLVLIIAPQKQVLIVQLVIVQLINTHALYLPVPFNPPRFGQDQMRRSHAILVQLVVLLNVILLIGQLIRLQVSGLRPLLRFVQRRLPRHLWCAVDPLARLIIAIVLAVAILLPPLIGVKLRPLRVTPLVAFVLLLHGVLITLRPIQPARILRTQLLALQILVL